MAVGKSKSTGMGTRWKGGRTVRSDGYVAVFIPEHPRATSTGYVREHVVVAERALGSPLPAHAEIHHVDENRANNSGGNLVICQDRAYHALLHQRMRALLACGDASARRCAICAGYDNQEDIIMSGRGTRHRACNIRDKRERRYQARVMNADAIAASKLGAILGRAD